MYKRISMLKKQICILLVLDLDILTTPKPKKDLECLWWNKFINQQRQDSRLNPISAPFQSFSGLNLI